MSQTTTEPTTDPARIDGLTETERCSLLASERRRLVLDTIEDRTLPVDLADVASAVAEHDPDLRPDDAEAMERLKVSLHHVHLPKLEECGVCTYDLSANEIRP